MDALNKKILRLLMSHGRMTNARLAQLVHLSESATLERVRRLEAEGILQGYQAKVEPARVGRPLEVLMSLRMKNHDLQDLRIFENAVLKMDEVLHCSQMLGQCDFILLLAVPDMQFLQNFIERKLVPLGVIERMESQMVLKTIKRHAPPFPLIQEEE